MRRFITYMAATAALLSAGLVSAQETVKIEASTNDAPSASGGAVLLGGRVGGIIPFGGLSPFVSGGIEAGYVFPWLNRSFAAALDVDYTAPKSDGSQEDVRLTGAGNYDWKISQRQLAIMPVVMYRLTSLGRVVPYAGIGPRFLFIRSTVQGSAGSNTIRETTEQSTQYGVGVPLGVEFGLGPGALIGEVLLQYGGINRIATGDTNTGAVNIFLGYRFLL